MYKWILRIMLIGFLLIQGCAGKPDVNPAKEQAELTRGQREIHQGTQWYYNGCYSQAIKHFFRAHELYTAADQIAGVAISLNNIGNVYRQLDDYDNASYFFSEAYDIYNFIQDVPGMLQILTNQAALSIEKSDYQNAATILEKAEDLDHKNQMQYLPLFTTQAILLTKTNRLNEAETILKPALQQTTPNNTYQKASAYAAMGNLLLQSSRLNGAITYYELALKLDRAQGHRKAMANDLEALGRISVNQKRHISAVNYFKRSIKLYALLGNDEKVTALMEQLLDSAQKAGSNTTLTKYFSDQWLSGQFAKGPCK
jgi:tetratricopeptide (TPR) repeat protein